MLWIFRARYCCIAKIFIVVPHPENTLSEPSQMSMPVLIPIICANISGLFMPKYLHRYTGCTDPVVQVRMCYIAPT